MESKNMFTNETNKVQQVAVISKIHNMQWLKNNTSSPGHIKPKPYKGTGQSLKEDFESNELVNENTMSAPNVPTDNNIKFVNSMSEKYNCNVENKTDERSFESEGEECTWDIDDKVEHSSLLSNQALLIKHLKEEEMISMAMANSIFTLQLEPQLGLKEQEKEDGGNTVKSNLSPLEMEHDKSEIMEENIQDNNNNNKLNVVNKPHSEADLTLKNDLEISNTQFDTISDKGANKGDQSNTDNINLSEGNKGDPLNLSNPDQICIPDINIATKSMISSNNDKPKQVHEYEIKKDLTKKEVPKIVTKKSTPTSILTSTPNKSNGATLRQGAESKMKYGIQQSIKNYSTEVVRKTQEKKNNQPSQSLLTSKVLKSKYNAQPKKESTITKHSSEFTTYRATKSLKEQNKSTPIKTVNKQYRVNRMCHVNKKEEDGSTSQIQNNSSKSKPHNIKDIPNYSNSSNSVKSTNNQSSNSDSKREDTKQNITLREGCINESDIKDKLSVATVDKEINAFPNETKEGIGSGTKNLSNERSTNEYVEPKKINTNPFLQGLPTSSTLNEVQTNTKDDFTRDNFWNKNVQLDTIPFINVPHTYPFAQQNTHQEQIPSHQNSINYVPNQFAMDGSVNSTLSQFHPDVSQSNANTMHLRQYGNMQTISNPSEMQFQNSSYPNVLPPNVGNMNALQYQVPNILQYNGQNMIRPPPSFCIHPMSQEEQFNLHPYGLSPTYFINPMCLCRNDCYPSQPQNWNLASNYTVPLLQSPYPVNYNSFYNQNMQPNNMIHKNAAPIRPAQGRTQVQVPREQNLQRNSGKPIFNSGYNGKNSQNNKRYNSNLQVQGSMTNTRENIDLKKEKKDNELLSDSEMNNLPMISPKACMINGNGIFTNTNIGRPQVKCSDATVQYHKNNGCHYVPKEYLPSNANIDHGTSRYTQKKQQTQANYKAQY